MLAPPHRGPAGEVAFLFVAHHLRAADTAEGPKGCQQINGFENVGFPLGVAAEQQMKSRLEYDIQTSVITKIAET